MRSKVSIVATILSFIFLLPIGRIAYADDQRSLVFVCDQDYPPITYADNGQPKGVVIDIIRALEKEMKRKINIKLMEWTKAQEAVLNGDADALCQMSVTEQRKWFYYFSDDYLTLSFSIFSNKVNRPFVSLADLHNLRVGVTAGGLPRNLLEAEPQIKLRTIQSYMDGFKMINDGELDAIVGDQWVGRYLLAENQINNIQTPDEALVEYPSAFAVKKGDTALITSINQGLKALKANGTLNTIKTKWRPQEVIYETREHAERKIYFFSVLFLIVLLVGASAWVITMRREVAERSKSEAELKLHRERLSKLAAHIDQVKESQRKRIAREIHDDLGGNLVAIKMVLHAIEQRSPPDPVWLAEKIKYIETLIDRTIDAGHRIVLELRPGVIDLGVVPALEWLTKEFVKQNNIPCSFSTTQQNIPVSQELSFAIFRMVQEALTNVAKHAHASQAQVNVVMTNTGLNIMIEDNGKGLNEDYVNKENSFGLLGMMERCKEIGGTIWIVSKPDQGCVVTIKIPT